MLNFIYLVLRKILPRNVKDLIRPVIKYIVYLYNFYTLKRAITLGGPINLIVGAALTRQAGWYSSNEQWLDITSEADWRRLFGRKRIIKNIVAEHVLEHLSYNEMMASLALMRRYMIVGGNLRVAVPDGYNPNEEYLKHCGISGLGADAGDHKQLLNSTVLMEALSQNNFNPRVVEGYTRDGDLVVEKVDATKGCILRSRSSSRSMHGSSGWNFPDSQTSLIVDGVLSSE